jgi:ribosomal protein L29
MISRLSIGSFIALYLLGRNINVISLAGMAFAEDRIEVRTDPLTGMTAIASAGLEAKEEMFNLRFQTATGQLSNNQRLRTVRQEIARIYTVLRERELGLAAGPGGQD